MSKQIKTVSKHLIQTQVKLFKFSVTIQSQVAQIVVHASLGFWSKYDFFFFFLFKNPESLKALV